MKLRFDHSPSEALAEWFPNTEFRNRQEEVIERAWKGKSSLVLMPTGMGKSLTYQLPVLASGTVGVIISPLVALMRQQAAILLSLGANVLSLGGTDALDAQESLRNFDWRGGAGFLFISPERAETDGFIEYLLRKNRASIGLVAVDEAHCISQWGHDFRPPYKAIPGFLNRAFGAGNWPTILCLTATLDNRNLEEVLSDFNLTVGDVVRSKDILRTNLDLSFNIVGSVNEKLEKLESLLKAHRGEKLIVYTHLKRNKIGGTRALARRFNQLGFRCAAFDADIPLEEKDRILQQFVEGDVDIVFATGAFGMGIDIPDIRGVIHFLIPESLEQYYQEVGRAGRDQRPAFGVLLHTEVNAKVRRDMIRHSAKTVDQVRAVWADVCEDGRSPLRTVSPWTEFQNKEEEHALFYAFQRVGALTVVARGPSRLGCFKAAGPGGAALLQRLNAATAIGNAAAAIRKLGLDPAETMNSIFDLYDRGELVLTRSPDKTLLFKTQELTNEIVQAIVADVAAKVQKRLADFDYFVELVESGIEPSRALQLRFGVTGPHQVTGRSTTRGFDDKFQSPD